MGEGWKWEWNYETEKLNCSSCSDVGFRKIDDVEDVNPRSNDQCSTRRIVKSHCKTEEVEPGIFIKNCEKTEQILKDCIGKPVEVVKSTIEYTEEDVTNEKSRGFFPSAYSELKPLNFPGLRDDIEAIEKNVFSGLSLLFEAAEEMVNSFDKVFGSPQHSDGDSLPSSSFRRKIPIESQLEKIPIESQLEKENETSGEQRNDNESVYSEFAGQVKDV